MTAVYNGRLGCKGLNLGGMSSFGPGQYSTSIRVVDIV